MVEVVAHQVHCTLKNTPKQKRVWDDGPKWERIMKG